MKQRVWSSALVVGALAFWSFAQTANASPFNVTVDVDSTSFVPVDIAPPAPDSSTGTVFTGVVGNNLSPIPVYRSPFEGTPIFSTAAFSSVEGPPPSGGSSGSWTSLGSGNALFIFWGSVDTYNTLQFINTGTNTVVGSITGADLNPLTFGLGHDFVALHITDGSFFNEVTISSSINAFEFSDLVVCGGDRACSPLPGITPIPAALPLFLSGIVGMGGIAGWRKRRKKAATLIAA